MSLAAEYRQQFDWRSWSLIFEEVPLQPGQTVLDLGCGIGDQARELASRGCKVIGLDASEELIGEAILGQPLNCEFRTCDLRNAPNLSINVDGIWCSFVAAYSAYEGSGSSFAHQFGTCVDDPVGRHRILTGLGIMRPTPPRCQCRPGGIMPSANARFSVKPRPFSVSREGHESERHQTHLTFDCVNAS